MAAFGSANQDFDRLWFFLPPRSGTHGNVERSSRAPSNRPGLWLKHKCILHGAVAGHRSPLGVSSAHQICCKRGNDKQCLVFVNGKSHNFRPSRHLLKATHTKFLFESHSLVATKLPSLPSPPFSLHTLPIIPATLVRSVGTMTSFKMLTLVLSLLATQTSRTRAQVVCGDQWKWVRATVSTSTNPRQAS